MTTDSRLERSFEVEHLPRGGKLGLQQSRSVDSNP